jgi:glycosyltransferase involved in cell wall biosynthesis
MAGARQLTMRIAIDALSITNFSGRVVLLGHLRNMAAAGRGRHSFHVLHHAQNRNLCTDLGDNVEWVECAGVGSHWLRRLAWQTLAMNRRLHRLRADLLISTSGAMVPGIDAPQVVLAQNPWCFFPDFHRTAADRWKARLQRFGYRRAQKRADAVFYLSDYLASAYRDNAGQEPRRGETVYVGVDNGLFASSSEILPFDQRELGIVTVSVMARHKVIEDVIAALALLHERGVPAKLALVGPWADAGYRQEIESLIQGKGLSGHVTITGAVDEPELIAHYRRARVFCLLSRCESFGIPAVEAQLFGTPCVVADACAPPEIAGPGGMIVPLADVAAAAKALELLLTDAEAWKANSDRASANVERFRWSSVSAPLIRYLDQRGGAGR